jgi:RNA polymerase sigma-70 factor, ECF subfamily
LERKSNKDISNELELVKSVRQGDIVAFKKIFEMYYEPLCIAASDILGSVDMGKDAVQEVFCGIWERRENWGIEGPLKPYLYRSVCNRAITYIKKDKKYREAMERYTWFMSTDDVMGLHTDEPDEFNSRVWKAIRKLPRRRKLIFLLHKVHGLSYREIAESLDISVKTVDNQMWQALRFLRDALDAKNS